MDEQTPPQVDAKCQHASLQAAALLAAGVSIRKTAAECGVSARTIHRWLRKPSFRNRVTQIRDRLINQAVGQMARLMTKGAKRLAKLLDSVEEKNQLAALRILFEFGTKAHHESIMRDRFDELAGIVADLKAKGGKRR